MGWGELDARKPVSCVLCAEMGDQRGAMCDMSLRGEEQRHATTHVSSACGGMRGKGKDHGLVLTAWWLVLVVWTCGVYA